MSVRARRWAAGVVILTSAALAMGALLVYRHAVGYPDRPASSTPRAVVVEVPRGATLPAVARRLAAAGVIDGERWFRLYATYKGVANRLRAGTYKLDTSMTPAELIERLLKGVPPPQVSVLIPEGKNMIEVAELLASKQIARRDALLASMRDVRLLRRLGVPARSMEGFLYPDTYKFTVNTQPAEVMRLMFRAHKRVYYALGAKHPAAVRRLRKQLGWGHQEIVTLASIVEKETGQKRERPRIASVFFNRMTLAGFSSRLLQTDPTIVYGCVVPQVKSAACQKFEGRIRRIQLDDKDNPYNTYQHPGLPPGPISNPGRAALEAVLAPERSRYLYFVSRNDGTHYFSRTRAEHERAVDYYQRGRGTPPPAQ